jgi:hypothetical protein
MFIWKRLIIAAVFILFFHSALSAQTQDTHPVTINISGIAAVSLVGGNLTLSVNSAGMGGQPPQDDTDNTCYLQYTSCISIGQTRTLNVAWEAGDSAPAGCSLLVTITPSGGAGEGSSSGQRMISGSAQTVITGITRCATGTSATDGANLSYTLSVSDATSLTAGESRSATVTFTLTDAS